MSATVTVVRVQHECPDNHGPITGCEDQLGPGCWGWQGPTPANEMFQVRESEVHGLLPCNVDIWHDCPDEHDLPEGWVLATYVLPAAEVRITPTQVLISKNAVPVKKERKVPGWE